MINAKTIIMVILLIYASRVIADPARITEQCVVLNRVFLKTFPYRLQLAIFKTSLAGEVVYFIRDKDNRGVFC